MTPAETSKALALAIGYRPEHVKVERFSLGLARVERCAVMRHSTMMGLSWQTFDYRNHAVIWPIAERYNVFPVRAETGEWDVPSVPMFGGADTAAKAVALAVIYRGST